MIGGCNVSPPPNDPKGEYVNPNPAATCRQCDLCKTRTKVVWGTGDGSARIAILGEAPGANEDIRGVPFIGRSGDLLNAALLAANLSRKEVYVTNTVKCRPVLVNPLTDSYENRPPKPREIEACSVWLDLEFARIEPLVVVVLGKTANRIAFMHEDKVPQNVGRVTTLHNRNVIVLATFHPSAALRSGGLKSPAGQAIVATLKRAKLYANRLAAGETLS